MPEPAMTLATRPTSKVQLFRDMATRRRGDGGPIRLVDYVAIYATTHEISAETAVQYLRAAVKLEQWAGETVFLTDLNELMVSAFLRDYSQLVKPSTVRSKRTSIMSLWRSAADEYLCEPPTRRVRPIRVPWIAREAWTLEEVRSLIRVAATLPRRTREGIPRSEWFDLAIRIAWDTGLRKGDLLRLRRANVHGDRFVTCQNKTSRPKCGALSPSTVRALEASLEKHPRDVLMPWSVCRETFNQQVKRMALKAGIRSGSWKWIRRGSATDVEIQQPGSGMAARHLGHAPGSKIAEINYIDHAQVATHVPMVGPRELG